MENAISVKNIVKRYGKNTVLNDINIDIKEGEFVCLLGPSGCGKSTLLRLIAGLDQPTEGKVFLADKDATFTPPSKRNFGIVFQSYALFPNLTAYENVAYGLRCKKYKGEVVDQIVNRFLDMVGLADAKGRYPSQLSGGEQQRVALARALAISPNFLLLDEPLSALDAKVRVRLRKEIIRIQKELKLTTIMVTHDQEEALTMADRIIVMNKTKVMQIGTPTEIYEHPANKFVADFVGAINFMDGNKDDATCAIRPENIEISNTYDRNKMRCVVSRLEFRGSFYRVTVNDVLDVDKKDVIVDIPYKEAKNKQLTPGNIVYVTLPDNSVLNFAS